MTHPLTPREKMKPCPFCGGAAEIERFGNTRVSTIYQCEDCGCSLETGEEFNHGRAWNRRTALASGSGDPREQYERAKRDFNNMRDDGSLAPGDQLSGNPGELKSGCVDHAELARLAEAATAGEWALDDQQCVCTPDGEIIADYSCCNRGEWEESAAYIIAVQPSRTLALLAENAALRAKIDAHRQTIADDTARMIALGQKADRATEAERALAEHRITADLLVSSLKSDKAEAKRKLAEAEAEVQRWKSAHDIAHEQATENGSAANAIRGKLAEAVQVIRDVAETPYTGTDWPRSRAATYLASKEAERG